MLLLCNASRLAFSWLFKASFLPTMKFQLSQLPLIVGSGRVANRRALFYVRCEVGPWSSQQFQALRRLR
jgi:hypothetical protein